MGFLEKRKNDHTKYKASLHSTLSGNVVKRMSVVMGIIILTILFLIFLLFCLVFASRN